MQRSTVYVFWFSVSSLLLNTNICNCQITSKDLKEYYENVHNAELFVAFKDTSSAVNCYKVAFDCKLPFLIDLNNAIELYPYSQKDSTLYLLFDRWKEIKLSYYSDEGILSGEKSINNLANYSWALNLVNDDSVYKSRSEFHQELQSLFDNDQELRRKKIVGNRDSILRAEGIVMFENLQSLILKFGWPAPQSDGIYNVKIYPLILHGVYYCGLSDEFNTFLKEQVYLGKLNAHFYAKIIDRFMDWNLNLPQLYGEWFTTQSGNITISNINGLDIRRKDLFLENYSEFCLKNHLTLPNEYDK